ncbi:GNAT family N-acetyltransferase [Nocardiopsis sp. RSe5-2]|uniref:GNAT family N-acetyltransferase n=1 Tax=Nocardiopsis endophytica TaxID=3018445 RepID=A0ABT4U456_9ACTN|nr:GNAT family N-acetyltransferase [Nocardiopsis endophytica]MDA2811736.1 GNAT family N-acetyltransferase [Nocardiopsis endophytica]
MEPRVRPAEKADMEAVAAVYAHYVTQTGITFDEQAPDAAAWRVRLLDLRERGLPFLVAETGGEVAGYALAAPWKPKSAYRYTVEDSVYLAPGRTGAGLGTLLVGSLLGACAEAGIRSVIAVIADTPDGAQAAASVALHERHGFSHTGRLEGVGYKHGAWLDTVLMQRALV